MSASLSGHCFAMPCRPVDDMALAQFKGPWHQWGRVSPQNGHLVNEKRIRRLMRLMGLMPIYPKPNTSRPAKGHKTHPYLLRGLRVERPNQVPHSHMQACAAGQWVLGDYISAHAPRVLVSGGHYGLAHP